MRWFISIIIASSCLIVSCVEPYEQGRQLYVQNCGNCHGAEGEGLRKLYPPIKNSDYLLNNFDKLPCMIRNGMIDTIIVNGIIYGAEMPKNTDLSTIEITNIINYITYKWYPEKPFESLQDINMTIESCK